MSTGLIALLDDIAGLAKVAAASLDDVATYASQASAKAAGVAIDDVAVTPHYLAGFAGERELPIVRRIAAGSMRNKLFYLLPFGLILTTLAPWAITPLLMLGGAFLCYEGTEKVCEVFWPRGTHGHEAAVTVGSPAISNLALEDAMVRGAIQTDLILSAEIMAIALSTVREVSLWVQVIVLVVVAISITAVVYGAVALIVKADDAGVFLARSGHLLIRAFGRGLVRGMPIFLSGLGVIGTTAMVWVGGGIILHGLVEFGGEELSHAVNAAATLSAHAMPLIAGAASWVVTTATSGIIGLLIGAALIPLVEYAVTPTWKRLMKAR